MPPCLPRDQGLAGQEGGQAHLQGVGGPADGVRGITVVGALAVEAEVARGGNEEGFEEVALGQGINVLGDVQAPPGHGDRPPEAEDSVQLEGRHLGIVPLVVGEVEVVGESLLVPGEPHGLHQGLASVIEGDYQL